jgi:hypothetical protein
MKFLTNESIKFSPFSLAMFFLLLSLPIKIFIPTIIAVVIIDVLVRNALEDKNENTEVK